MDFTKHPIGQISEPQTKNRVRMILSRTIRTCWLRHTDGHLRKEKTMDFLSNLLGGKKNKSEALSEEELQKKNLMKRLKELDREFKANPNDIYYWYNRALALQKLGKFDEAIRTCKEGIASCPSMAFFHLDLLGSIYTEMNRYEDALKCFEDAILHAPTNGSIWNSKGWALENLGRFNEARTAYQEGARLGDQMAVRNLEGLKEKEAGNLPIVIEVLISGTLPEVNRQRIISELQQKARMRGDLAIKASGQILSQQEISIECESKNEAEQLVSGLQSAGCHAAIRISRPDLKKTPMVEKNEKHCPSCDWIVPADAIRCIKCGHRFVWK
jgi:tetratricopeptide (TPR) repeat protein